MKVAIILNGISGKKKKFYRNILPVLQQKFNTEVFETKFANHAFELAAACIHDSVDVIISAGGDGTLNQVVNGMLSVADKKLPTLALIPLGSGNDFANTIGATTNVNSLTDLLLQNNPSLVDVGSIQCQDVKGNFKHHYFINECSLGMGPATVRQMEHAPKWLPPNLRYLTSIIKTFFTHKPEWVEIKTEKDHWKGKARVVAIANGKTFGSKIYIAPDAKIDDGIFNTFVVAEIPLLRFLLYLQVIKGGKKIDYPAVKYSKATSAELSSQESTMIEAEGELVGQLPASIKIEPKKIPFLF